MPHLVDRLDHRAVERVGDDVLDELAVDLEEGDRQLLEVAVAGHAGAEVVEREAHPARHQLLHQPPRLRQVLDRGGLGDLEAELAGRHPGPLELGGEEVEEPIVPQRHRRQVDGAEAQGVEERRRLVAQGLDRVVDHPAVDRPHQAVALGGADEVRRQVDPPVVLGHAQQHLEVEPRRGARRQRLDLLREEAEAVALEGLLDAQHPVHLAVAAHEGGVVLLVDLHPVAPFLLGRVAGVVGGREEVGDGAELAGDRHHADARPDGKGLVAPGEAEVLEGVVELAGPPLGVGQRAAREEDGELVAAQARHQVGVAHRVLEQGGHPAEQLVPRQVAAGVVDQLELVEVHVAEGVHVRQRPRLLEGALEVAVEGLAVEQAGQLVVGRLVGELEGHQALVRDVLEDQHGADDLAVVGADRGAGALDRVAPPVAPLEGDPFGEAEALPLLEAVAEQRLDVLALAPLPVEVEDLRQGVADGGAALPAGELLGHRVQVFDAPLAVGRQHAVADRGEGDLGELLLGVELGHLGLVGARRRREQIAQDGVVELERSPGQASTSRRSTRMAVRL